MALYWCWRKHCIPWFLFIFLYSVLMIKHDRQENIYWVIYILPTTAYFYVTLLLVPVAALLGDFIYQGLGFLCFSILTQGNLIRATQLSFIPCLNSIKYKLLKPEIRGEAIPYPSLQQGQAGVQRWFFPYDYQIVQEIHKCEPDDSGRTELLEIGNQLTLEEAISYAISQLLRKLSKHTGFVFDSLGYESFFASQLGIKAPQKAWDVARRASARSKPKVSKKEKR